MIDTLKIWHQVVKTGDTSLLDTLLDDDAVMISPVVHTHQKGKAITKLYLSAAASVIGNEHFKYVREVFDSRGAILEFETEVDGLFVNGVDIISWNEEGKITEFKVMVRPLQALNILHQKMGEMLQSLNK